MLASIGMPLLSACATSVVQQPSSPPPATAVAGATTSASAGGSASALPLGDGHVGSAPQAGWIYSCRTTFPSGGGAAKDGPWIHGATWDATTKLAVQGAVKWPQASFAVHVAGGQRVITTSDLPVGFATGVFPISSSDPAFAYDRNPNTIRPMALSLAVPASPTLAAAPSCLGLGPIGVLTDGVVLFDALDGEGRDAVAHEILDQCGGHPEMNGEYHHHDIPPCVLATATGASTLVGYANDGFGIYVERDAQGNLLTNAALDACHGRTSMVMWNGQQVRMYHYVATAAYPYTLGCYMGTPARIAGG